MRLDQEITMVVSGAAGSVGASEVGERVVVGHGCGGGCGCASLKG